jgi:hypothetical protein
MTDPNQPQYPHYPAGGQPAAPPPRRPLTELLGIRAYRRPEPRLGVALAGVGVALVIVGILLWAGDYVIEGSLSSLSGSGSGGSDARRLLGVVLSLAVIVLGYTLVIRRRRGPLATAGVAASALGVPVLFAFLTLDLHSGSPVSADAVAIVSILVWLLTYLYVPGARGHAFYLALAGLYLWEYVLGKTVDGGLAGPALSSVQARLLPFGGSSTDPDWASVAGVSIVFGLLYYALAFALDRRQRGGVAVALVVPGFVATAAGLAALAAEISDATGTGLVLILFGVVLGAYGGRAGRRFTTWVWAAAAGSGLLAVVADQLDANSVAVGGVVLIVLGVALVVLTHVVSRASGEPDEFALRD